MSTLSEISRLVPRLSTKDGGIVKHDWATVVLVFAAFITFVVTATFNGLNGSGAALGTVQYNFTSVNCLFIRLRT